MEAPDGSTRPIAMSGGRSVRPGHIVHYEELRVTGTTACSASDCRRAADIINSGGLDAMPLVTRTLSISEASAEFVTAKDHSS
jgi:threonine dehydrogenase-like Zn-dependent dehydrogenase